MSLYKDASLVMIPSAYKDGKLYSIRPTDGSGDFTFSRGSNLAATRVDVNGLIEKGRENLLLQSNQFDTTWANIGTSPTSGQSGYDGSNDAWLLTKSTASARVQQSISVSGVKTISLYAKANASEGVMLRLDGGTNPNAKFDLVNETLFETNGSPIEAKIESVGNGWYRCSMSTDNAATFLRIYPLDSSGSTAPTSGSIYIQDAQLEAGLVATDYIETGASTAQAGILEDMPRLDYSGGASCPALLLEPQRTNQVQNSEYLSGWTAYSPSSTISINSAISPEGVQNACEITFTGSGNDFAYDTSYYATTSPSVFSVYLRVASGTKVVALRTAIGDERKAVTITTEWQRFDLDITSAQAAERVGIDNRATYGASGTAGTIEVYGAQLEAGSYPTSYIPTMGASVTRSADDMDTTFSSAFTTNGGVSVLFDIKGTDKKSGSAANGRYLNFATNSTLTTPFIAYNRTSDEHRIRLYDGSSSTYSSTGVDIEDDVKIVVTAQGDTHKIFSNGVLRFTRTTNSIDWSSITDFVQTTDENIGVMDVKQLVLFPTQLTDAEAIALTTI